VFTLGKKELNFVCYLDTLAFQRDKSDSGP
jgi:hypothetical protein